MRSFAEFVMKGRTQAIITVVLATGSVFFAWIGAAVIALVTLRKGTSQGVKVLYWAMIPAVMVAFIGDTAPLTTLLGVMFAAVILRATLSWTAVLTVSTLSGLFTGLIMLTLAEGYIAQIIQFLEQFIQQVSAQQGGEEGRPPSMLMAVPSELQVAGLLGVSNAFTIVISLLLARWWQALLYNPGGFKQEFHKLRVPPLMALILLIAIMACWSLGSDYILWAILFALPFLFAGFALAHGIAGWRKLNPDWLAVIYFLWFLFEAVKIAMVAVAVVDSFVDIRGRLPKRQDPDDENLEK